MFGCVFFMENWKSAQNLFFFSVRFVGLLLWCVSVKIEFYDSVCNVISMYCVCLVQMFFMVYLYFGVSMFFFFFYFLLYKLQCGWEERNSRLWAIIKFMKVRKVKKRKVFQVLYRLYKQVLDNLLKVLLLSRHMLY